MQRYKLGAMERKSGGLIWGNAAIHFREKRAEKENSAIQCMMDAHKEG